jgi:phosphoribosylformylglycinamidine synthase I
MTTHPRVCILRTDGTNCDEETAFAFAQAGAHPEPVHINQLRASEVGLGDFQILAIPGGFSYGDDLASGKVLANELLTYLRSQVEELIERGGLVIGICNGFQVLVRTGLLPFCELGDMRATLAHNNSGHFQCRWVELLAEPGPCVFTQGLDRVRLQMAHGEGRFWAPNDILETIESNGQVALRYAHNPNGSINEIAGICDPTGRIFGLMPHPERNVLDTHDPNWRRGNASPLGRVIFENAVRHAAQL